MLEKQTIMVAGIAAIGGLALGLVIVNLPASMPGTVSPDAQAQAVPAATPCRAAYVIDGDTIACATGPRIRLASIDAPELPGHCRTGRRCVEGDGFASKAALAALIAGHEVRCVAQATDTYGRTIARCSAGGADLSCAMVGTGHAVQRYGALTC